MERSSPIDSREEMTLLRRAEAEGLIDPDQGQEAEKIFRKVEELGVPMTMSEILTQRGFLSPPDLARIRQGPPPDPRPAAPPPPAPREDPVAPPAADLTEAEGLRVATLAMKAGLLPPGDLGDLLRRRAGEAAPLAVLLVRDRGIRSETLEALVGVAREESTSPLTQADLDLCARAIAAGGSPIKIQDSLAAIRSIHGKTGLLISMADALFKTGALDADALDEVITRLGIAPGRLAAYRGSVRREGIPEDRLRAAEEASRVAGRAGIPLDVDEVLFLQGTVEPEAIAPGPVRRIGPSRSPSQIRAHGARSRAAVGGGIAAIAIVCVILIVLAVKTLGGPTPGESGEVGRGGSRRTGTVSGATEAARERIEWGFRDAVEYALKNPDDVRGVMARYEALEAKHAGTPDADRAREAREAFAAAWEGEASEEADLRIARARVLAEAGDFEEARLALSSYPIRYRGAAAAPRIAQAAEEIDRVEEALALRAEKEDRERREAEERRKAEAEALEREASLAEEEKGRLSATLGKAQLLVMDFDYEGAIRALEKSRDRSRSRWAAEQIDRWIPRMRGQVELFGRLIDRLNGEGERPEVGFGSGSRLRVTGADREGVAASGSQVERLKKPWIRISQDDLTSIVEWAGTGWADAFDIATFAYDHGLAEWGDEVLLAAAESDPIGVSRWIADRRGVDPPEGGYVHHQGEWIPKVEADHLARGEVLFEGKWRSREELVAELRTAKRERDKRRIRKREREEAAARAKKLLETEGIAAIETLEDNGDVSRRVDIVIVSDGFTEEESSTVGQRAGIVKQGILGAAPFSNYKRYINVHLVRLVEEESGINQPPGKPRKTKVGATLQGNVLTCNPAMAWKYGNFAPDCDLVAVIANVSGGRATGGGGVITLNKDGSIGDVVIHELGHAYGGLDDEYVDAGIAPGRNYGPEEESAHVNTTRESDPKKVKWHYWNFPPLGNSAVGCFEGAYYHDKGYYRPGRDCRMRSSGNPKFCPVCQEQMERMFYRQLEPLEAAWPERRDVRIWADGKMRFEIEAITILGEYEKPENQWYIDGVRTNADVSYQKVIGPDRKLSRNYLEIRAGMLPPGRHEIVAHVDIKNPRIRRDHGHLSSTRVWSLEVSPRPEPGIDAPKEVRGRMRRAIAFLVRPSGAAEDAGFALEARGLPRGASFEAESGLFRWIPDRYQRGLFRVTFLLGKDGLFVSRTVDIKVRGGARDSRPVMKYLLPPVGMEGEEMTFRVEAIDVDGDHLTYWSPNLPTGAALDPETGVFRWTPGLLQADTYEGIRLLVGDAQGIDEQEVTLSVKDRPMGTNVEDYRDFELVLALRSPNAGIRGIALDEAERRLGQTFIVYEYARRMRLPDPQESLAAMESLRRMLVFQTGGWKRDLLLHFLKAVGPHCRQFVDRPEVLEFLEEAAKGGSEIEGLDKFHKGRVRFVLAELDEIRRYNESRLQETGKGDARVMRSAGEESRGDGGGGGAPAVLAGIIRKGGIRPWPRPTSCSGPTRARKRTSRPSSRRTPASSQPISRRGIRTSSH